MADPDSHQNVRAEPPASVSPDKATLVGTLVHLWPYIWPGDRADLKMRVVWSVVLLLIAKLATLTVPFTFKWAIDALNGTGTAPVAALELDAVADRIAAADDHRATACMRVLMAVLTQWRDGIFARVAMHAVRKLAYHHLRPHARTVAALSPRAQDRRPDARAGARPLRHRSDRARW